MKENFDLFLFNSDSLNKLLKLLTYDAADIFMSESI